MDDFVYPILGEKTQVVMEKKGTVQGKGKRGRERKGKTGEEEKKRLKTEYFVD